MGCRHLSYAPASLEAIKSMTVELLNKVTSEAEIFGKDIALELIPSIYENHILNYVSPDEQRPVVSL